MKELELKEKEIAAKNELDLKERELTIQKELDLKEKELQMQLKLKELELKAKLTPTSKETTTSATSENFDFTRHVKLVPPFQEHEVDKFFLHFEKIATNLHWPSEVQAMLLQSVLIGKAREVYSALSVEQSADYSLVKREILRAYELVPEAYRQRFRDAKCHDNQTYMEFAREKETLFNKWCASQQVGNSFDKLRQLILLEEFKKCVPTPIKTYLEEQKASELQRAASLADDYKLTHKSSTTVSESKIVKPGSNVDSTRPDQRGSFNQRFGPTCAYCKKRGHLMSECWILQKKERKNPITKAGPVPQLFRWSG